MGPNKGVDDYQFRVQGVFDKPLYRQVDEAVRLGQIDAHGLVLEDAGGQWGGPVISLNSREEYYRPRIMRYSFEKLSYPSMFLWKFLELYTISIFLKS